MERSSDQLGKIHEDAAGPCRDADAGNLFVGKTRGLLSLCCDCNCGIDKKNREKELNFHKEDSLLRSNPDD
jgi:hypothetical protein